MDEGVVHYTRRNALAGIGAIFSGSLAGCFGLVNSAHEDPVSLLVAGSLNNAIENGFRRRIEHPLDIEAHGSVRVARMVAEEQKSPDIVAVADTTLFDGPLHPSWYGIFATNSLVLAYQTGTEGGQRIASAGRDRWFEPVLQGTARLGRTDPDMDPLGYRTLFMLELASRYYDTDVPLHERLPENAQIFPETQLVSQFETGSIDAAVTYHSMALERGYEYIELPPEIDIGHPEYTDKWYSTVSYSLPNGNSVDGAPVCYGAIIRDQQEKTVRTFEAMTEGSYLQEFGFGQPNRFPDYKGNVPAQFSN